MNTCSECGERLVYTVFVVPGSGKLWPAWTCDCDYKRIEEAPNEFVREIWEAREFDQGSIVQKL